MKILDKRLSKLENRFGLARSGPRYLLLLMDAGKDLPPEEEETYLRLLDEAGLLPPIGCFGVIDLRCVPHGLSPEEMARFVREKYGVPLPTDTRGRGSR
jgi:hypothetical protein